MLIAVLDHPDRATRDMSSVQTIMSGASAVPAALVRRIDGALGCRFSILFGQTEMHGVISQTADHRRARGPGRAPSGARCPSSRCKIADPVTGETLPIGEQGEICCRGYQNMLAYFDLPEETAATIDADGWLHMGDLGTMDERGYLQVTGRLKDMIIRGGMNIYPAEIEELLYRASGVAEAAVIGVPDEKWGERSPPSSGRATRPRHRAHELRRPVPGASPRKDARLLVPVDALPAHADPGRSRSSCSGKTWSRGC